MENNSRDAVLSPALHWNTDIVSVGERHAQAVDGGCGRVPITDHIDVCRVGTDRRIPVLSWGSGTGEGFSKFGPHDLLPYCGGWAQAKGSTNLEPMICCLITAVGYRQGFSKKRNL